MRITKYITVTLLIILASCTNPYFKKEIRICSNSKNPTKSYFPLEVGNKWTYRIEYSDNKLEKLDQNEIDELIKSFEIELGEIQKVQDNNGGEIDAYPIKINGEQNNYHYLIECGKGSTMIEVYNPFEPKIVATFPVFEVDSDTTYWDGVSKYINIYAGEKTFRTNKGSVKTLKFLEKVLREGIVAPNRKNLNPEIVSWKSAISYYGEGIGLFMREVFDKKGNLLATYILEPYNFEYETSPISP